MVTVHVTEILEGVINSDFLWILIPIFFIGIVTDKYQEEFGTSVGNAISNGALIIFTGFSWMQQISSREYFPIDITLSQYLFAILLIVYGFSIVGSGFKSGQFAKKYGRIRVVTFMLMFFTMMIYVPILYNFVSIVLFVFIFPFYYAFITELIKIMPSSSGKNVIENKIEKNNDLIKIGKKKIKEYLD